MQLNSLEPRVDAGSRQREEWVGMKSARTVLDRAGNSKEVAERVERLHGLSLVLHPAPVLRAICRPVSRFDSTLRDLLQEMEDLMLAHAGIGLAGPQVAIKQRLLIQHERDHLNGMLILDHGSPLGELDCPVYEVPFASLLETPP